MTTSDTVGRVPRPRGEVPKHFQECIESLKFKLDATRRAYREAVLDALRAGGSFNEVSRITGLSKDTLQRWKREAGK